MHKPKSTTLYRTASTQAFHWWGQTSESCLFCSLCRRIDFVALAFLQQPWSSGRLHWLHLQTPLSVLWLLTLYITITCQLSATYLCREFSATQEGATPSPSPRYTWSIMQPPFLNPRSPLPPTATSSVPQFYRYRLGIYVAHIHSAIYVQHTASDIWLRIVPRLHMTPSTRGLYNHQVKPRP